MNEIEFKKGLESLKNVRMTDAEKARVLKNVLETPVVSPYLQVSTFTHSFFQLVHVRMVTALSLVVAVSFGGMAYASDASLPGEVLYQMKVGLVEPIIDQFNRTAEKKVAWEEEKVERRIQEAEALVEIDKLNDKLTEELERRVEKSSRAFAEAVEEEAKLKSAGLVEAEAEVEMQERVEKRKQEFRERFGSKLEDATASISTLVAPSIEPAEENKKEKVERLKRKAFEVIEKVEVRQDK